ncbi:MAG: DUF1893 domain-containing protein [Dehalococcoidales bacterium]|nr:DUF1893 domain-containing protein [Dehalococcoidales bacterium]
MSDQTNSTVQLSNAFLVSADTLRVYENGELVFASAREQLSPLLEYIERCGPYHHRVLVLDRIMGNAAALLCVIAQAGEIYSPLGSELAIQTLKKYGIKYHLSEITPCIRKDNSQDMCPMERLSINKSPAEFYQAVRQLSNHKE